MEKIINALVLSPEQKEAFLAAAPGVEQVFLRDSDNTAADLEGATVLLGNPSVAAVREGGTSLRWMHTRSAGADQYMPEGVLPAGAVLSSSVGAYGISVSEHMFAMLMALMKRLPDYRDNQNAEIWKRTGTAKTLRGAKVLIGGAGDIGSSFALLCKAFGAETLGIRRNVNKPAPGIDSMHSMDELDDLLAECDVAALVFPRSPETDGLMSYERIKRMKPDAILINAGRGTAVDCEALAHALSEGHLFGAALDVTDPEPLPAGHPLWKEKRALITPHVAGGNSLEITAVKIAEIALENLRLYLDGQPVKNRLK